MFARAVPLGNALPAAIVVNFSSSSGVISANSVTRSVEGRVAVVCVIVSFIISEGGCALCLRNIQKWLVGQSKIIRCRIKSEKTIAISSNIG